MGGGNRGLDPAPVTIWKGDPAPDAIGIGTRAGCIFFTDVDREQDVAITGVENQVINSFSGVEFCQDQSGVLVRTASEMTTSTPCGTPPAQARRLMTSVGCASPWQRDAAVRSAGERLQ